MTKYKFSDFNKIIPQAQGSIDPEDEFTESIVYNMNHIFLTTNRQARTNNLFESQLSFPYNYSLKIYYELAQNTSI